MNKRVIIKLIVFALAFIVNIVKPIKVPAHQNFIFPVVALLFGSLAIPFVIGLNSNFIKYDLVEPKFSDNPFTFKKILIPASFFAQLFLVVGVGVNIGALVKYHVLNSMGITAIAYGIGVLIGIRLTLIWIKPKLAQPNKKRQHL